MQEAQAIRKLWPLLKLYPSAIPVIVLTGTLASLSEGLGISLFIPLLQSLIQGETAQLPPFLASITALFETFAPQARFLMIGGLIFTSILLKSLLLYGNTIFFSWLNWRISHRLRAGIFQQLLRVSYTFLDRYPSGKFLSTLDNETWRTSQALSGLVSLVISACTVIVFGVLLLMISWQLTLLVSLMMVMISVVIQLLTRQIKQVGKQAEQANAVFVQRIWDGLLGMRVIRAFGREDYEQRRFEQASQQVCQSFMQLDRIQGAVSPVSEVLSTALLTCALVIALQNPANLPTLLTFIFMLYRLQPHVRQIDGARVNLISLSTAVDDVTSLLETHDKPYIQSGYQRFWGLQRAIALRGVSFRYHPQEPEILQHLTLTIPQGKTTAIVGPSGAGKSTLIHLICRFYDPTAGEIWIDDQRLQDLHLPDWRRHIAIVSQSVHIFSTTIRDNIAYGCLEATEAEIVAAAQKAHAHEFITQLPQGYDTVVGEQGIRLSGGQRQRIALARAMIARPSILILDEATNALDSISEHLIQEAIAAFSQQCTVIVIAHRLSTIEQADQIVVIESGRIREQGSFGELLRQDQLFAQLYRLQNRSSFSL